MKQPEKTILVIDDEERAARHLARALATKGFKAIVAHTGEDGIKHYLAARPDFVLLDLILPTIDGMEVLKQILSIDEHAKVLMVTGETGRHILDKAKGLGAVGYIIKPLDIECLFALAQKFQNWPENGGEFVVIG